jgi:hypothetical protein
MPLTGNAPWGTPGHAAANRHCSLGPAPAPVTSPPGVEWKEPSGSAEGVCVTRALVSTRRMPPPEVVVKKQSTVALKQVPRVDDAS